MSTNDELDSILKKFTDKLVDINNYQSFIKNSTKRSLEHYSDQIEKQKTLNIDDLVDFNSLSTWDLQNNDQKTLGKSENSFEDLIEMTQLQNNRQYQNLLVDAYESYLKYLDELYGYLCFRDNDFWSDKIQNLDISGKSLESIIGIIKNKNNRHKTICTKLKEKIPTIELLTKINAKNIDFTFELSLIEHLRHWIVHNRGRIDDIDKLIKKIIPNISTFKKDIQEDLKNQVKYYIGEVNSEYFVLLLEFYHKDNQTFFRRYNDRLGDLVAKLASYAKLLKDMSVWYLSDNENLKKLVVDPEEYKKFFASSVLYKYLRQS